MGTYDKAAGLATRIKRECKGHDTEEVGVALSSILVEFAQHIGMPKEVFMEMISGLWDLPPEVEDENEVRH